MRLRGEQRGGERRRLVSRAWCVLIIPMLSLAPLILTLRLTLTRPLLLVVLRLTLLVVVLRLLTRAVVVLRLPLVELVALLVVVRIRACAASAARPRACSCARGVVDACEAGAAERVLVGACGEGKRVGLVVGGRHRRGDTVRVWVGGGSSVRV